MTKRKKTTKTFIPFAHQDLELKNGLIQHARDLRSKGGFENQLASAFIYASFTEYLANNLLDNLEYFTHRAGYIQYAGILFIDETGTDHKMTLGNTIKVLSKYQFPDKEGIVELMWMVCRARNNIFHNFAKSDTKGLEKIVTVDLILIQDKSESLLEKVNIVYDGLKKILLPVTEEIQVTENSDDTKGVAKNK